LKDHLEESLHRFETYFGWDQSQQQQTQQQQQSVLDCRKSLLDGRLNKHDNTQQLSPNSEPFRILSERNLFDLKLYDFIQQLFHHQSNENGHHT